MALGVIRINWRSSNVSVVTRLAAASMVLGVLWLGAALVSLSLGPVHIPISHLASIILEPINLDLITYYPFISECNNMQLLLY